MAALDTEAVTTEVVMAARCADQTSRWVSLQPPLSFSTVPDAVLRPEHPSPTFAVEHREVTHSKPERPRLKPAAAPLVDQQPIAGLGVGERIHGHAESIARART